MLSVDAVANLTLRTSPEYRLVPADDWSGTEIDAWPDDAYGVVLAKKKQGASRVPRIVGSNDALLLISLAKPKLLPFFVRRHLTSADAANIESLVFDGYLEVEAPDGFCSGLRAAAYFRTLGNAGSDLPASEGSVEIRALRHIQSYLRVAGPESLGSDPVQTITSKLYHFNAAASSQRKSFALETPSKVYEFLGIENLAHYVDPNTGTKWEHMRPDEGGWWHYWRPSRKASSRAFQLDSFDLDAPDASCKLYLSPQTDFLPETLAKAAPILWSSPAKAFKVGANRIGMQRPDKFVAYFSTFDEMMDTARRLEQVLPDTPVQGVPFTSPIRERGLLSWGVDPDSDGTSYELTHDREFSWRTWICRELAKAMIASSAENSESASATGMQPYEFALQRAEAFGVDTRTWSLKARSLQNA